MMCACISVFSWLQMYVIVRSKHRLIFANGVMNKIIKSHSGLFTDQLELNNFTLFC